MYPIKVRVPLTTRMFEEKSKFPDANTERKAIGICVYVITKP